MNEENQNPYGDLYGDYPSEENNWSNNEDPWGNQDQFDQLINPWVNSQSMIDNAYMENPYEANWFDNAYTESFANPNPENEQDSGWEI